MAMKYDEIKELYVATAVDEWDGQLIEGVCAYGSMKNGYPHLQPLVMSGRQYKKSFPQLHALAEEVARSSGAEVTIRRLLVDDSFTPITFSPNSEQ